MHSITELQGVDEPDPVNYTSPTPHTGMTGMKQCPVCGEDQNADDEAFQHHVNAHFEAGVAAGAASSTARCTGVSSPKKRRLSMMKDDQEPEMLGDDYCPLCAFPFFAGVAAVEREQHVNACMDTSISKLNADSFIPFSISAHPSRTSTHSGPSLPNISTTTLSASTSRSSRRLPTPPKPGEAYTSPTILLSDQMIQQSIASGRDDLDPSDEWDGPAPPGGFGEWLRTKGKEKGDRWWDPRSGGVGDVPENFSPGLIPVLNQLLESSVHKGITKRAVLGRDAVSITGVFRFDSMWGCGYRNALMALSALTLHSPQLAKLFSRESNGAEPGVRRLQGWLDEAWAKGYDPEGKAHFGGEVLGGRRWVGTGDLYALFTYKGVPCDLYDFPKPKTAIGRPAHKALTEWVKQYFDEGLTSSGSASTAPARASSGSGSNNAFDVLMRENEGSRGSAIRRADRYPLVLQHNGHSRTVVGYEETSRGDMNLLMFDPGKTVPSNLREAGLRHTSTHRPVLPQSTRKESHESHHFSPPYTNGASELTNICDTPAGPSPILAPALPQRLGGGAMIDMEEDEEVTEGGWVKKRLTKLSKGGGSALGVKRDDTGKGGKKKIGEGKGVAHFRVNLSTLGRHEEYQILAFTGDKPLSALEQSRRKYLTSTVIT